MTDKSETGDKRVVTVIVNYRTPDLALECVASLRGERAGLPRLTAILVDGGSADESAKRLDHGTQKDRDWLEFLPLPINGGYGWANNQAMLHALQSATPPDFIFLLNPDAQVTPGAIQALLAHMANFADCGAAGSQLIGTAGELQVSAFRFPSLRSEFVDGSQIPGLLRLTGENERMVPAVSLATEVDWVPGAGVLLRSEALRRAGLFDDGFFLYFEEVELMWRIRRAGYSVWTVPASRVIHIAGASTGLAVVKGASPRLLPDYWYQSHKRLMVKMFGPRRARFSAFLWLLGRALGAVRAKLQPSFARRRTDGATSAFRRAWRRALSHEDDGWLVDWRDVPGKPPRWMEIR